MSERTETPLIDTLRSIAECDPAYRDLITRAANLLEQQAATIARIIADRDAARKAQGEQMLELLRAADAIAAMQVTIADLLTALEGVVRVADRQAVEFDAARAAIANTKATLP